MEKLSKVETEQMLQRLVDRYEPLVNAGYPLHSRICRDLLQAVQVNAWAPIGVDVEELLVLCMNLSIVDTRLED